METAGPRSELGIGAGDRSWGGGWGRGIVGQRHPALAGSLPARPTWGRPHTWSLPHLANSGACGCGPAPPTPRRAPLPELAGAAGAQRGLGPTQGHPQVSGAEPRPQGQLMFSETSHYFYLAPKASGWTSAPPSPPALAPGGLAASSPSRRPQPRIQEPLQPRPAPLWPRWWAGPSLGAWGAVRAGPPATTRHTEPPATGPRSLGATAAAASQSRASGPPGRLAAALLCPHGSAQSTDPPGAGARPWGSGYVPPRPAGGQPQERGPPRTPRTPALPRPPRPTYRTAAGTWQSELGERPGRAATGGRGQRRGPIGSAGGEQRGGGRAGGHCGGAPSRPEGDTRPPGSAGPCWCP